jgi:hypothetical protein
MLLALLMMPLTALAEPTTRPARPYESIGVITHKPITECSGIIASRKYPGVFWIHCDSGNDPSIYAITREGKLIAEFPVNAKNEDWEDIATDDDGHLYIGDIGGGKRKHIFVYRIDEPDPTKNLDNAKIGPKLQVTAAWKLTFPDAPFDCESLFVYKGEGYVISKLFTGLPATIYKFPLEEQKGKIVLEKVTTLPIHSPATAADISPDGKRLAVLTVVGLNIFQIDGDVANAGKVKPAYTRLVNPGLEGCTFVPDGVIVAAESREIFLFHAPAAAKPPDEKK